MSSLNRLECVLRAADPVQGQAVCEALRDAGIDARAVCEDQGTALEIFVPAAFAPKARRIIRDGDWPRLV